MGRIVYPLLKAFDASGKPLVGGRVYTYEKDSTTRDKTYADYSKAANSYHKNPIILNADGEAKVFLHDGWNRQYDHGNLGLTAQLDLSGKINEYDAELDNGGSPITVRGRNIGGGVSLAGSQSGAWESGQPNVDDDFSDSDRTFTLLWTKNEFYSTISIESERLKITSSGGTGHLSSNFKFSDDFEIILEFDVGDLTGQIPDIKF